MEWTKNQYNKQYETWVPWLEDIYLRYFTRDNKASYTTRGTFLPFRISISFSSTRIIKPAAGVIVRQYTRSTN